MHPSTASRKDGKNLASIIEFCVSQKRPSKEGFDIVIGNPPYIQLQNNGGELAKMYEIEPFHVLELDEYITLLAQFLRRVGCGIVIERLVSTSPANRLIAPHWGVKANEVALRLKEYMHEKGYHQGDLSTETLNRRCL